MKARTLKSLGLLACGGILLQLGGGCGGGLGSLLIQNFVGLLLSGLLSGLLGTNETPPPA